MLFGRHPFGEDAKDKNDLKNAIENAKFSFPEDIKVSDEAKNLISGLLMYSEKHRL
jgi:hypothetical protein